LLISDIKASMIVEEECDVGKTLKPSGACVSTEIFEKNSISFLLLRFFRASCINLPLRPNESIKSSCFSVFVRLQRPPPLAFSLDAIFGSFSRKLFLNL